MDQTNGSNCPGKKEGRAVKPWTQREDDVILEMWATHSAAQIASILNRTRNSVIGRAVRRGLPRKSPGRNPELADSRPSLLKNPVPRRIKRAVRQRKKAQFGEQRKNIKKPLQIIPVVSLNEGEGISIMELEYHHCRDVIGRAPDGTARYCGAPRIMRINWQGEMVMGSFCAAHAALYYREVEC